MVLCLLFPTFTLPYYRYKENIKLVSWRDPVSMGNGSIYSFQDTMLYTQQGSITALEVRYVAR